MEGRSFCGTLNAKVMFATLNLRRGFVVLSLFWRDGVEFMGRQMFQRAPFVALLWLTSSVSWRGFFFLARFVMGE